MRLLLMIVCLLSAVNASAVSSEETGAADVQGESAVAPKTAGFGSVQQDAPTIAPDWAGADRRPRFNEDTSLQPSYDAIDSPSFGPDSR